VTSGGMTNLTNLTETLVAGAKYSGILLLPVNDTVAADGFALDFNGGSATMTSVEFGFVSTPVGWTMAGVNSSTALATAITATVVTTSDVFVAIAFTCVCNAAGTLIPRIEPNSYTSGTLTVQGGGSFTLNTMNN
jgi:hypothetical protein